MFYSWINYTLTIQINETNLIGFCSSHDASILYGRVPITSFNIPWPSKTRHPCPLVLDLLVGTGLAPVRMRNWSKKPFPFPPMLWSDDCSWTEINPVRTSYPLKIKILRSSEWQNLWAGLADWIRGKCACPEPVRIDILQSEYLQ